MQDHSWCLSVLSKETVDFVSQFVRSRDCQGAHQERLRATALKAPVPTHKTGADALASQPVRKALVAVMPHWAQPVAVQRDFSRHGLDGGSRFD